MLKFTLNWMPSRHLIIVSTAPFYYEFTVFCTMILKISRIK